MGTHLFHKIFSLTFVLMVFIGSAFAQEIKLPDPQSPLQTVKDDRTTALAQLGLSKEQVQEIRHINIDRKPLMQEAQKRSREATRMLNEAIYSDQINDMEVQSRLKEVQLALADVARIRFMNEVAVRRVLTPEQLIRFRELRQRFEQARDNIQTRQPLKNRMQDRMRNNPQRPLRQVKQQIKADAARPQ